MFKLANDFREMHAVIKSIRSVYSFHKDLLLLGSIREEGTHVTDIRQSAQEPI